VITIVNLIEKILSRQELIQNPPILIDIGASNRLHPKWSRIAKYSWCVAFDADQRDFQFTEDEDGNFKKLFVYNCVVSDEDAEEAPFYLTRSPYCSSVLEPYFEKLQPYVFSKHFDVEEKVTLKSKSLNNILNELNIKRVDWFKTDSQGIDLRLFRSLDSEIQRRVLVGEFEPGIIDAYKKEDKLFQILEFFQPQNFWLSDIIIKGVPRIPYKILKDYFSSNFIFKLAKKSIKETPGWGEITFFNDFEIEELFTIREYLLAWVFAMIEKQHPFALILANKGIEKFNDIIFEEMEKKSISFIKKDILKLGFLPSTIAKAKNLFL